MTPLLRRRQARRYPGLYRATVVDADDPQGSNRLQVSVPSLSGSPVAWAPQVRGLGTRAGVGEQVLVGFEAGELASPFVVGVLETGSPALVAVDADMVRFSGVVQCSTLIAESVIAASYSPGAGNIS